MDVRRFMKVCVIGTGYVGLERKNAALGFKYSGIGI
jgi:hypothetical protein